MNEPQAHVPLGQLLIDSGVITVRQRDRALATQRRVGGTLGRILLTDNAVNRQDLYEVLASQSGVEFVDLITDPPQAGLTAGLDPEILKSGEWIPYRKTFTDGKPHYTVATANIPSSELTDSVRASLGDCDVTFVMTTHWDIDQSILKQCRDSLLYRATESLADENAVGSAKYGANTAQRLFLWGAALAFLVFLIFQPRAAILGLFLAANLAFFVAVVFKVVTTTVGGLTSVKPKGNLEVTIENLVLTPEIDLPTYTVLIPVFREDNIIHRVIENMESLDWPKTKLQVLLLCEEEDLDTINAIKKANPPEYITLLIVPAGTPQTKPRACNFGLSFATGEFLVIYDAEDRPESHQLREAHARFMQAHNDDYELVCLQAPLNYFNVEQNVLTRMFTLEYSMWFDGMIRGMGKMKLPIPLGGTSNHFRVDLLRKIGGWDPYNVTEDADLGMRASALGYRVDTISATTWEEACSKVSAFIPQRTRWIKGYIVTSLVDLRQPIKFIRNAGWRSTFTLFGLIAGTPALFLSYPLVWGATILTFLFPTQLSLNAPSWLVTTAVWNAIVGNALVIALTAWMGVRRHGWRITGYSVFNPIYWFLHSYAAWRALYQTFRSPHKWEKTPHGISHEVREAI